MRNIAIAALLACLMACVPVVHPPQPPPPAPSWALQVTVRGADGTPLFDATGSLQLDLPPCNIPFAPQENLNGRLVFIVPGVCSDTWGGDLLVGAPSYVSTTVRLVQPDGNQPDITLQPVPPPVPAPPTRDQALLMNLTFQGLTCHTDQFGDLNWFEAALPWLNASDRQKIYACKHAAGDTHVIIQLPVGNPVYNECCNDFSPDRFGALDWSAGQTHADAQFANLVVEIRNAGFIPMFFSGNDGTQAGSLKVATLAIDALQHSKYGDITNQVGAYMTGWDGVFYGWEPSGTVIPAWATSIHAICPTCRLGIEFNPGHIPIGGGPADWAPGGRMSGYDLVLGEFFGWKSAGTPPGSQVWQIVARLIQGYRWPVDEPANEDSHPAPFYLTGGQVFCAFEFDEYLWVRHQVSAADISAERDYFKALGVKCTG